MFLVRRRKFIGNGVSTGRVEAVAAVCREANLKAETRQKGEYLGNLYIGLVFKLKVMIVVAIGVVAILVKLR